MILNIVDLELIIILKNTFQYPRTREQFFECLREIDKDDYNREKILSKSHIIYRTVEDFYKDITEEKLSTILNSII